MVQVHTCSSIDSVQKRNKYLQLTPYLPYEASNVKADTGKQKEHPKTVSDSQQSDHQQLTIPITGWKS